MMKVLYLMIGCISMVLGAIGVILPVLPTTPFLLVSAFCFAKGSKRFHTWFLSTNLYQAHLDQFIKERAMTLRSKVLVLSFASIMLLLAMIFMEHLVLRLFLGGLMIFKYYYFIFRIQTISADASIS